MRVLPLEFPGRKCNGNRFFQIILELLIDILPVVKKTGNGIIDLG